MPTITLENGTAVNISEESYKALQASVQKKAIPWRAEKGGQYCFVNDCRHIVETTEDGDNVDDYYYLTGNYFQTKEQAEKALAYSLALGRVTHAILKANDGWEADWKSSEDKCQLFYAHNMKKFDFYVNTVSQHIVKLPYIKSRKIAEQIIKDHKEDLNVIFEV